MKINNDKLDELFAKASIEKPVLSEFEVSSIIESSPVPVKFNLFKKIANGDKTMFSIFSIATAIVSIVMLNMFEFDNKQISKNSIQNEVHSSKSDDKNSSETIFSIKKIESNKPRPVEDNKKNSDKPELIPNNGKFAYLNSPTTREEMEGNSKQTDVNEIPKADDKIKGIKSIRLEPQELEKLGISIDKDGAYISVFTSKSQLTPKRIYVDWKLSNQKIESKPVNSTHNYIIPRMITDNKGQRRIDIISDNNNDLSIDTYTSDKEDMNVNILMNSVQNSADDSKTKLGFVFDSKINVVFSDSLNNTNINWVDPAIITNDNSKIKQFFVDIDPNDKNNKMKNIIDSLLKTENLDKSNIDRLITSKRIVLSNDKIDTAKLDAFDLSNAAIFKFDVPKVDINKLLPVEVPVPNAKDKDGNIMKDFSFILWLNLDKDTYENLPERMQEKLRPEYEALNKTDGAVCGFSPNENGDNYLDIWRTCAGAIENLNSSPNPTSGNVNLEFILKENRNISISVNDVFGKKIKEVVSNQNMKKGSNFYQFDISDLESGMYLVVLQTNAGEQAVHRIILKK